MVVDFALMKSIIKEWLDDNFDHNLILHELDRPLGDAVTKLTGQKIYYINCNPTAENIALHLKMAVIPVLFAGKPFNITTIKLFETSDSFIEV